MITKKLRVLIAPALLLGLTACNNNADNAMDLQGNNQTGARNGQNTEYDVNHVNYRGLEYERINRNQLNNTRNVNNNNNDAELFDNRGPLTEDYTENRFYKGYTPIGNTNDNRVNRRNRDNNNNYTNTRNRDNNDRINTRYRDNNDTNDARVRNGTSIGNYNNNVSSFKTSQSSKNYPHTKAILIQEAKFRFVPVQKEQKGTNANQAKEYRKNLPTPANLGSQNQNTANQQQTQQQAQQQPKQQENTQAQTEKQTTGNISQVAQQVIDLTNEQRSKNGLPALKADPQLSNVAQTKSNDMREKGYFSHTSPTYGSPFDMMRDFGVSYRTAGENIAQGQRTAQEVVQAWMDSEGHRKNILSRDFTHIGVGYDQNGHHWTQMFIGK